MIEVENRSGELAPEANVRKLLEFSIQELGLHSECELSVAFINDAEMEATVIDGKVDNLLGVLDWDIPAHTDIKTTFDTLFSFE